MLNLIFYWEACIGCQWRSYRLRSTFSRKRIPINIVFDTILFCLEIDDLLLLKQVVDKVGSFNALVPHRAEA